MEENFELPEEIIPYNTLNDKPETLLGFINKYVKLQLVKNHFYTGFVNSIDPISHSIILSVPVENTFQTTLISGHYIMGITEVETDMMPPTRKKANEAIPIEEIIRKKKKVIAWFQENFLPVTEAGNSIVVGSASILPPYSVMDICSENPVINSQLKNLIASMPDDFEPK